MRMNLTRVLCTVGLIGFFVTGCKINMRGSNDPPPPPPEPTPAPAKPAPKKTLKLGKFKAMTFKVNDKGEVQLPGSVLFETGTATLRPESDAVLDVVKSYLEQKPQVTKLRIEGHTDSDGDEPRNQTLSENRAMSVSRWLVARGIDCKRLVPVGFGESRLLANPDDTEDKKAQNRRVVPVNAEIKGAPIQGRPVDGGGTIAGDPCQ